MEDKELVIPRVDQTNPESDAGSQSKQERADKTVSSLSQEEADAREKVFFEEDEKVRLRDGKTYYIPPLGLKDAKKLMKNLNSIDSGVIIANLIPDDENHEDRYMELLDVLLMAFKPYYNFMTVDYLEEYVDLDTAKKIIDSMIGLNGLKKSL